MVEQGALDVVALDIGGPSSAECRYRSLVVVALGDLPGRVLRIGAMGRPRTKD